MGQDITMLGQTLNFLSPQIALHLLDTLSENEMINIPFAHAEGRFIIPDDLLEEMKTNDQTVFRYCDYNGKVSSEFPTNPNGSDYNLSLIHI